MTLPELDLIVEKLRNEDDRWEAIIELKIKGNVLWVPALIPLLKDKDWIIRWAVAEKLGDLRDPSSIRPLLQSLVDKDFHVAKNAHKALSRFGHAVVPDAIRLFGHKNVYLRQQVMDLLSELGEPILPLLKEGLDKSDWIISNRLVHLIWTIGKHQSENMLISSMGHPYVQKNVIILLGILKSKPAIPHFILLYGQKPSARRLIFQALKLTGTKESFPVLVDALGNSALEASAETMILKIGPAMIPYLVNGLELCPDTTQIEVLLEKIDGAKSIIMIRQVYADKPVILKKMKRMLAKHLDSSQKNVNKKGFFNSIFNA